MVENLEKSIIGVHEVIFLGFRIRKNCVKPTLERSQGIIEYPSPRNKKQLQRFLGMINYDRPFIEKASDKLQFLYALTQKSNNFNWDAECEAKFKEIKDLWKQELELVIPDWNDTFSLETDASNIGLGGVLKQNGLVVAYISRTLKKAERNYSATEKEVLAALWAMEKLGYYLDGREFELVSDHEAIKEMRSKIDFGSAKISRWFERLERFNYKPKYRKGAEMIQADALSRAPGSDDISNDLDKILEVHVELSHRKGILKEVKDRGIIVTEKSLKEAIDKCEVCKRKDRKLGSGLNFVMTKEPGERVGVDMMDHGNVKIILAIDYFTRKVYGMVLKTKSSDKVLKFIQQLHEELNIKTLLSDNGKEFCNRKMKAWAEKAGVEHVLAVPYYHDSNGRVERVNRTIGESLKKTKGPLGLRLKQAIEVYNTCNHRGIGMSPNNALLCENWETVLLHQDKYSKEISKNKGFEIFNIGQKVLIRNETRKSKIDDEFKNQGIIIECLDYDVYNIKLFDGKVVRRHSLQLKRV